MQFFARSHSALSPVLFKISASLIILVQVIRQGFTSNKNIELINFFCTNTIIAARVNGQACMDSTLVQATHFVYTGLHLPGNTSNPLGSKVTPVTVGQLPGLNTLGIALARIDYAAWGVIPPHAPPRFSPFLRAALRPGSSHPTRTTS